MKEIIAEIAELPSYQGYEFPFAPQRVARKIFIEGLKRLPHGIIQQGFLATSNASLLRKECLSNFQGSSRQVYLLKDNIVAARDEIFVLANRRTHPDEWGRDDVLTTEALCDPRLEARIIRKYDKRLLPNGQMPTVLGILGRAPWHIADDETTLDHLIWSARLKQDTGGCYEPTLTVLEKELAFIRSHIRDGWYITGKGERHGWLDAFIYPAPDVNTQNQGLYTVALLAAESLGLKVGQDEIQLAQRNLRLLARDGFLPFSYQFSSSPDASVLYPEYLAITIFGQELLTRQLIQDTIEAVPDSRHGKKVLSWSVRGDDFNPSFFITEYPKGVYQNGGVWPVWWSSLMEVGQLYGIRGSNVRAGIIASLERTDYAESINTGGQFEEILTPRCPGQVWNLAVLAQWSKIDKILLRDRS